MKHKLLGILHSLLALLALALATTVWSAPLPRPQWFPLQAGNDWTLTGPKGDTRTIHIEAAVPGPWRATGLFNEPVALRFAAGGVWNLQARVADRGRWQTMARFARREHRPWWFNLTGNICGETRAWWAASDATLVTPAGTFTGCRRWHSAHLSASPVACPPDAAADLWFAPDVGPVGLLTGTGDWYWLTAATVGDHIYPVPTNGIVAHLTTDQSSYTNVSDHYFICPPCTTNNPPCMLPCYLAGGTTATAAFTFVVTNVTPEPQTFVFPTSQTFDLQLIDTNGVIVARWSDGRAFADVVTTLVLPPNQSVTYPATMKMVDHNGDRLSGPYTARAYLTNTSGPADVAATAAFQVIYELVPAVVTLPPSHP